MVSMPRWENRLHFGMITDPTKLPKSVECDGCKHIFTSQEFLWHNCSADQDCNDLGDMADEDELDEEDLGARWQDCDRDVAAELPGDDTQDLTARRPQEHLTLRSVLPPTINGQFESLPFKFLASDHTNVVEELRSHIRRTSPGSRHRQEIDWARFYTLQKKLNASVLALGEGGWWGYAVYRIPGVDRFVLDSVVTNNAAYVIEGDWRKAIHYSKAEIRAEYRLFHKRIVHKSNWIGRVQDALKEHTFRPVSNHKQ